MPPKRRRITKVQNIINSTTQVITPSNPPSKQHKGYSNPPSRQHQGPSNPPSNQPTSVSNPPTNQPTGVLYPLPSQPITPSILIPNQPTSSSNLLPNQSASPSNSLSNQSPSNPFPNQSASPSNSLPRQSAIPSNPTPSQPINTLTQTTPDDPNTSAPRRGRNQKRFWTVQVDDGNGVITEEKLRVKDVWLLPSEKKVVVDCNEYGQGIGDGGGLIAFWLGDVATDANLLPLNIINWNTYPAKYIEPTSSLIKENFILKSDKGMKWVLDSLGVKRREYRNRLRAQYVRSNRSRESTMNDRPDGITEDQWNSLVDYWLSEKSKKMSEANKKNRMKLKFSHIGGSKSNARRRNEMEIEKGRPISRAEVWHETHTNMDGVYVNEDARIIGEQILARSDLEVQSTPSIDDTLGQVLGKEHPGRVCGMGLSACPSSVFKTSYRCPSRAAESSSTSHVQSLQTELIIVKDQLQLMEVEQSREKAEFAAMRKFLEDQLNIKFPSQPTNNEASAGMQTSPILGRRSSGASHDPTSRDNNST